VRFIEQTNRSYQFYKDNIQRIFPDYRGFAGFTKPFLRYLKEEVVEKLDEKPKVGHITNPTVFNNFIEYAKTHNIITARNETWGQYQDRMWNPDSGRTMSKEEVLAFIAKGGVIENYDPSFYENSNGIGN
jgi:hypothetical protein